MVLSLMAIERKPTDLIIQREVYGHEIKPIACLDKCPILIQEGNYCMSAK